MRSPAIFARLGYVTMLIALLSLSSCSFYKEVEVLEIVDIEVTEFKPDLIEAKVIVKAHNPNWYAVTLTQSDIDVFVNKKEMGKVNLVEKVKLKSKTTDTKTLLLRGTPKAAEDFLGNLLGLLFQNSVEFQAKGFVTGKALLIKRDVPVDLTEAVQLK